jgi:hypothetical protein
VVGNIANLQWFMVVVTIPIAVTATSVFGRFSAPRFVFGLLIALSAPAVLIIVPVVLWPSRIRQLSSVSVGVLLGIAIQVALFFRSGGAVGGSISLETAIESFRGTVVALSNQVVLPTLLGQRHAYSAVTHSALTGPFVVLLFVAFIAWLATRLLPGARWRLIAGTWLIISSLTLSMVTRQGVRILLQDFSHAIRFGADRYFFCSCCIFAFCIALGFEKWSSGMVLSRARWRALSFAFCFLLSGIVNFRIGILSDMQWPAHARLVDQWKASRVRRLPQTPVSVPVNPAPWTLDLPGSN